MKKFLICLILSLLVVFILGIIGEDNVNNFGRTIGIENVFGIVGYNLTSVLLLIFMLAMTTIMFQIAYQVCRGVFHIVKEVPLIGIILVWIIVPTVFLCIILAPFVITVLFVQNLESLVLFISA